MNCPNTICKGTNVVGVAVYSTDGSLLEVYGRCLTCGKTYKAMRKVDIKERGD